MSQAPKGYIVEDDTWPPKTSSTRFTGMRLNGYEALYFLSDACDLNIDTFLNPLVKVIRKIYILEVTLCIS